MEKQIIFPMSKSKRVRRFAKIESSAVYFPPQVVTNEEIIEANSLPVTDIVVRKKLGVMQRHIADFGVLDSDILTNAAKACLDQAGVEPDKVTRILVTKFLGDNILPMTAAMVQRKLGCEVTNHCYDIDGGINSFLQAFDIGSTYIATGDTYVLIVSGGIIQYLVNSSDPRLSLLFGDGAASILLGVDENQHILGTYFFSDYNYVDLFTGFDISWPLPEDAISGKNNRHFHDLYRQGDWRMAINAYLEATQVILRNVCSQASIDKNEINHILITENNLEFVEIIVKSLEIPDGKHLSIIGDYGNLMSASLPALLDNLLKGSSAKPGDLVLVLSFGEGISGGGIVYRV